MTTPPPLIAPVTPRIHLLITHYNSLTFLEKCVSSVLDQEKSLHIHTTLKDGTLIHTDTAWSVTFIDDASTDTGVADFLDELSEVTASDRIRIHRNTERQGKGRNLLRAIRELKADPEDVIAILDGDDWLASPTALRTVLDTYRSDSAVWVTYGSYVNSDGRGSATGCTSPMGVAHYDSYARGRGFREAPWVFSHLFTAKVHLWRRLAVDGVGDALLTFDGRVTGFAVDQLFNLPIAEMAGPLRIRHITTPLVIYNIGNPLSDHYVDRQEQRRIDLMNRARPAWAQLSTCH